MFVMYGAERRLTSLIHAVVLQVKMVTALFRGKDSFHED